MNTKQLVSELNGVTTDSYAVIKDGRVEIYAAYEEDEDEKIVFSMDIMADNIYEGTTNAIELEFGTIIEFGKIIERFLDTPVKERVQEEKFYLKTISNLIDESTAYINYNKLKNKYTYSDKYGSGNRKTTFTESEIENIDTTGFYPKPVEINY